MNLKRIIQAVLCLRGFFETVEKQPCKQKTVLLENRVSRGLPVPQKLFHPNVDRLEVTKKCRINTSMPAAACLENLVKHTLPDLI